MPRKRVSHSAFACGAFVAAYRNDSMAKYMLVYWPSLSSSCGSHEFTSPGDFKRALLDEAGRPDVTRLTNSVVVPRAFSASVIGLVLRALTPSPVAIQAVPLVVESDVAHVVIHEPSPAAAM